MRKREKEVERYMAKGRGEEGVGFWEEKENGGWRVGIRFKRRLGEGVQAGARKVIR